MSAVIGEFFDSADKWAAEVNALRPLVVASGLVEELKWNKPCYTHNGKNVVMIAPFSMYCALAFFQGTLLKDSKELLVSPGKDSQSVRQLRFKSTDEITQQDAIIASYLQEAIAHVDAGTKVDFKARTDSRSRCEPQPPARRATR